MRRLRKLRIYVRGLNPRRNYFQGPVQSIPGLRARGNHPPQRGVLEALQLLQPRSQDRRESEGSDHGEVGVGKTALAPRFGRELESKGEKKRFDLTFVYVNPRFYRSPRPVVGKLAKRLPGIGTKKGFAAQEENKTLA
ncbi:hypothetical protein AKJ52_00385 [candidate division MSBL1 archaeon SCGC-AAA382C18]|uniref:Uncharacterized protein n=1 Tax=candidate division MSBL1 archaeon SCGC-AAA382C18 TaxID=1698281 RepID=A0A133VLS6_9EURY|nr:hypothetical protein AKJ52_00385 [candidate division MSBL1 archaeon SCGC-AAA382C18]